MALFEDRESKYPGRFLVTDTQGNRYHLTMERADVPVSPGTPLNAATFNAMFEDMMWGAAAVNSLDNADFAHPVNQRGGVLYSGGYTIDRWRSSAKLEVYVEDGHITLVCADDASARNGFTQYIAAEKTPAAGTPVTVAYEDADGNIYMESGEFPATGYLSMFGGSGIGVNLYSSESGARLSFMVPPGISADLTRIALYEGAYTKDTLPLYRRKDYAAELMECMRYYQVLSTGDVPAVDLRPTMRDTPTITKVSGGYAYSADL